MTEVTTAPERPKTFTAERKAQLLVYLESGKTIQDAAKAVGVSRNTVDRHRKEDSEFGEQMEFILNGNRYVPMTEHDLVKELERSAKKGTVSATIKLMEYRAGVWPRKAEPAEPEPEKPTSPIAALAARKKAQAANE